MEEVSVRESDAELKRKEDYMSTGRLADRWESSVSRIEPSYI